MTPLVQERLNQILTSPSADWRDLPNIYVPGTSHFVSTYGKSTLVLGKYKCNFCQATGHFTMEEYRQSGELPRAQEIQKQHLPQDTSPRKNTVSLVNWPKLGKYKCPELMKYKYNICQATGRFAQEEHRQSGELARAQEIQVQHLPGHRTLGPGRTQSVW